MDYNTNEVINSFLDQLEGRGTMLYPDLKYEDISLQNEYLFFINRMEKEDLLINTIGERIEITAHGQKVVNNGGWIKYLKKEEDKRNEQTEIDKLKNENEKLNNKFLKQKILINKWKIATIIFSIISGVIGFCLKMLF